MEIERPKYTVKMTREEFVIFREALIKYKDFLGYSGDWEYLTAANMVDNLPLEE